MNEDRNEFIHQLHIKFYRRLIRTAYRETGDMETASDLVQEVFVLATLHYDTLRTYDAPEAWLHLTLHYQVLNQRRMTARHNEVPLPEDIPVSADSGLSELLPAGLSPEDQAIIRMKYETGLDHAEISNRLGISEAACRSRLSRALSRCKKLLKKQEKGCNETTG